MSQFRAHAPYELPNMEFRSTKDEAVADAMARVYRKGEPVPDIIVQEVTEPNLGDFFSFDDMVSSMRERMAEKIGNDDALSDSNAVAMLMVNTEGLIREVLNDYYSESDDIRIDGYLVLNTWTVKDWAPENGEA